MRESIVSFLISTTEEIQKQVEGLEESMRRLNESIDNLTEKLTNTVVDISENFQALIYLIQSSREAQFNVIFSMFTKHMEALEEIRDVALNFTDKQKQVTEETHKSLNALRKKMLDYEFQTFIFNLKDLITELKRTGE
ncbi:MAG: hypothetical protein ACTSRW_13655 [Candidatus Helarchaeota archaeon]